MYNKIAVILFDAVGDYILTTPFLQNLREFYPNATIDVFAHQRNIDMAKRSPFIDHVYLCPHKGVPLKEKVKSIMQLRGGGYDLLIDSWHDKFHTACRFMVKICGIKTRVTTDKPLKKAIDLSKYYNHILITDKSAHFSKRFDVILNFLQPNRQIKNFPYFIAINSEKEKNAIECLKSANGHKKVGISCTGSRVDNTIPVDILKLIIERLLAETDFFIFLTSAPGKDNPAELLENYFNNPRVKAIPPVDSSLDFTVAVIKNMDVVLTTSTATLHMASAFNVPTVGVYSNNPVQTALFLPTSDKQSNIISTDHKMAYPFDIDLAIDAIKKL